MNLRRIRHFVVLAEALNFHRAAQRLHIAQPALTVSIQKLEAELGVTLFSRDARGVSLTAAGKGALPDATKALYHGQKLLETSRFAGREACGTLRVGFVGSTTYQILPTLIEHFTRNHPKVEFEFQEAVSGKIAQMLEDEALDVGLIRTPVSTSNRVALMELESEEFVLAVHRTHPLATRAKVSLVDLKDQEFLMYREDSAAGLRAAAYALCQFGGFLPRVCQLGTQIQTLLSLVEARLGIALVPENRGRHASDEICIKRIADYPSVGRIGLALATRNDIYSPITERFRHLARELYVAPHVGAPQAMQRRSQGARIEHAVSLQEDSKSAPRLAA